MNRLKAPISITALSSISALGSEPRAVFRAYQDPKHYLVQKLIGNQNVWVGALPNKEKDAIGQLRRSDPKYRGLDDSVLYALYTSRKAVAQAGWGKNACFGINIGSSRGATTLFENYHKGFLEERKIPILASPTTTLGNISSWVAHDLQSKGPVISHSITCSTALHAVLNAVAWIQGGLATKFLVGGSEAPLTPFTIAQMQALKIYSNRSVAEPIGNQRKKVASGMPNYPSRTMDLDKNMNTMVLGEGAGIACLEKGNAKNALAKIIGIGYATETLEHNVSISTDAQCFQDSMKMALGTIVPREIDAVVMHAPGTIKGDSSEMKAIQKVFLDKIPFLTTNKWKLGHTFGASGMLSIEMAALMLIHQKPLAVPFVGHGPFPKKIGKILVNAVGFGGNAVSILVSR